MDRLDKLRPNDEWSVDILLRSVFDDIRAALTPFVHFADWPSLDAMQTGGRPVRNRAGVPLQLEAQFKTRSRRRVKDRARDEIYDARIAKLGLLPTRARNWHDFFNWMVWQTFPLTKACIAQEQYQLLCGRVPERFSALPSSRLPEQDALTILDEGGVVCARSGTEERLIIFGHALFEHFASSDAPIRAAVLDVAVNDLADREIDCALASTIARGPVLFRGSVALSSRSPSAVDASSAC